MDNALVAHSDLDEAVRLGRLLKGEFRCRTVGSAAELPRALWSVPPRLLVLDLSLPGLALAEALALVREDDALSGTSVLALLDVQGESCVISALEAGVDDFVAEPIHPAEFRARARALVRRPRGAAAPAGRAEAAGIALEVERRIVTAAGRSVALSATECRLLAELVGHPGEVKSKEYLIAHAWGMPFDVSAHTLDSHISNLRRKLGPAGRAIETVRGVGYVVGKRKP